MDPMTIMALASAASGFFGKSRIPKEQQELLRIAKDSAQRLHSFGTGVPGSDPGEMAALAQQRAMLGESQLQQQQQMYGALSPMQGGVQNPNLADFLQQLSSGNTAQRMALESQHMMNALASRRQALQQAAGIAQGSAGLAQEQQTQSHFPQMLQQLSAGLAQQQAMKDWQKRNRPVGSGPGETPVNTATGAPGVPTVAAPAGMGATMMGQGWGIPGMGMGGGTGGEIGTSGGSWMVPGMQTVAGGMMAPGNQPGGANAVNNQARQAMGMPDWRSQFRRAVGPSGIDLSF